MRASDDYTQLGLRAWEQQRRSRRARLVGRSAVLCLFAGVIGWTLPEAANPYVLTGAIEPLGKIRMAQAQAIATAVKAREVSRQSAFAPMPLMLTTPIEPLPSAPFPPADVQCLAQAVYGDARGDHLGGQIGVAQVMLNRHRVAGGATLCQVIDAARTKGQLCTSPLGCPKTGLPNASNRFWMQAQWIAEEVAAGRAYLRELEHAYRYHYHLAQPVWRLTHRPVRRLGQNVFYISVAVEPDMTYASSRRPWDEPAQFEMIGEEQSLSAGQLVTSSSPSPVRKAQPVALPANKPAPSFNPFANTADQR